MYHSALKKEEEEYDRLTHELEITSNSLKSTKRSLQESMFQTYQLQKELRMSHISCFMEGNVMGIMGNLMWRKENEKREDSHMLGKCYEEDDMDQEPIDG